MASTSVKSNRMMKRAESKKSHSWWWDSHISPKNSKWLQEHLEEMDQYVKRMLTLIEEDADSFAKKAEMYYQKRPELINLVEEFYRMYRSLAERYDHVTGELRKNIPSELQSQCSGISDVGSEPPSTMPSPDRRSGHPKSGHRAAGFDLFLGGGTELYNKEGDESSTLDSESESDASSFHNYSGVQNDEEEQGLRRKIIELEAELREVKEKLQVQEEEIDENYFKKGGGENCEAHDKITAKYDEELQVAKEKIRVSEEKISRLTIELQRYESLVESSASMEQNRVRELQESFNGPELVHKIQTLEEELSIMQKKLWESEEEVTSLKQELTIKESNIQNLQDDLKSAEKELSVWKNNLDKEAGEVAKLQYHIERYKTNLSKREQEIWELKEAMSNVNKSLSEENEQLKAEISRLSKEQTYLDDNLKELDSLRQSLEEDLRRVKAGEAETEELNKTLHALQQKYDILRAEKDELNANISALSKEVSSKDDQIDQMSHHLQQLHMEHVNLIAAAEVARKSAEELRLRIKELEGEVEKKQQIIVEGAEEKREAIRQLCFSLEHYRNGYHRLREVVVGNKGTPVMAT